MKAIFIDVDNTILDFDEYTKYILEKGFSDFSLGKFEPYMLDAFHEVNNQLWRQIEKGEISMPELQKIRFQRFFDKLGINFDGITFEKYYKINLNESAIPVNHAYEMLEYLSKKYILCVASNGPYNQQLNRLRIAKMDKYFKYFFVSEKLGHSKPSKEFFAEAFKELNKNQEILPNKTWIIGDSLTSDMAGGKNFGLKTCFYNKKNIDVSEINVDLVINDLIDTLISL